MTTFYTTGGDIECRSHGGSTPLHVASTCGKEDVVRQLLAYGARTNTRDYGGRKAKDLVKDTVSEDVQRSLGKTVSSKVEAPASPSTYQRNNTRRGSLSLFKQLPPMIKINEFKLGWVREGRQDSLS